MPCYPQCSVMTVPKAYRGSLSLCPNSLPRPQWSLYSCWLSHIEKCQTLEMTHCNDCCSEQSTFVFILTLCNQPSDGDVVRTVNTSHDIYRWASKTIVTWNACVIHICLDESQLKTKWRQLLVECASGSFIISLTVTNREQRSSTLNRFTANTDFNKRVCVRHVVDGWCQVGSTQDRVTHRWRANDTSLKLFSHLP